MNAHQPVEYLLSQLNTLAQKLTELLDLLRQEETALTQNEFSTLESLAQSKELLSVQIDQLEKQRRALCSKLAINDDFTGIQHYLGSLSASYSERLEMLWDNISNLGKACTEQNQINGILVANQQRYTEQALSILRGATGSDSLYSATGAQQTNDSQQILGRV